MSVTMAAEATLGLGACSGRAQDEIAMDTNAAVTDMEATTDEALTDVNAAATDAMNAADAALDNAGEAVENAGKAVEIAAETVDDNAAEQALPFGTRFGGARRRPCGPLLWNSGRPAFRPIFGKGRD